MAKKTIVEELVSIWKLKGDARGAQEIKQGIDTIKSSIKGLTVLAAAGGAALTGVIMKAGKREQIQVSMEVLLGDVDLAKKTMEGLIDFANRTPFETKDILDYGKQLIGVGFEAEKVAGMIETLGNAAAGVGMHKMPTFVEAINSIKAIGKVDLMQLKRIMLAGIPIMEEIAKHEGVTRKALAKRISKGDLTVDDVMDSLKRMTSGSGRFAGMMQKQSLSLFGLWSTIMGTLDDMVKTSGQKLLPVWKELMKTYIAWFAVARKGIEKKLVQFYEKLSDAVLIAFFTLKSFFKAINSVVKIFGGWGKVIKGIALFLSGTLVYGIGMVTSGLFGLLGSFIAIKGALAGPLAMFVLAQAKFLLIGAAIAFIVLAIQDWIVWMQGGESQFGKFYESVAGWIDSLVEKFEKLQKFFTQGSLLGLALDKLGFENAAKWVDKIPKYDYRAAEDKMMKELRDKYVNKGNQNVNVNLNVEGLSPEVQADEIASKTGMELERIMRETERDSLAVGVQ